MIATTWSHWREHFERNQTRPPPLLTAAAVAGRVGRSAATLSEAAA